MMNDSIVEQVTVPEDSSEFKIPSKKIFLGPNIGLIKTAAGSSGIQSKFGKNSDYGISSDALPNKKVKDTIFED